LIILTKILDKFIKKRSGELSISKNHMKGAFRYKSDGITKEFLD